MISVGRPTGLAFTPDGRLLITTQPGRLRIYANGALLAGSALDLSSIACANSEQGLLGVAVDPAFASTGYIYLFYTIYRGAGSGCRNRVSRFILTASNTARPTAHRLSLPLRAYCPRTSLTAAPISAGLLTTRTPALLRAAIFSTAVPLPPEMIAPA
jgi:hypothetical protein